MPSRINFLITLVLICATVLPPAYGEQYSYSDEGSQVMFDLKHLGIVTASGKFDSFQGKFRFDPENIENSSVSLNIKTASVNSGIRHRDESLKSKNFFWSEKFPEITFESVAIKDVRGREFLIFGNLTIRGITRPVIFDTRLLTKPDAIEDGKKVSFYTETFIRRKDFNLGTGKWSDPMLWITDEQLRISLNVEGVPVN